MTWTLLSSSHAEGRDRYVVAPSGEYFAVSINDERPRVFHRLEASAMRWIAQRELAQALRAGTGPRALELVFANERGERATSTAGTRR